MPKCVVLIGPSQMGKSTLGNWMLHGCLKKEERSFQIGVGSVSCTKEPATGSIDWTFKGKTERITIMDTAGVGDTDENHEAANMLGMYRMLSKMKDNLAGAILVISYKALFDDKYRDNLKFYKKLFGKMFHGNVTIVITSFSSSETWKMEEEISGVSLEDKLQEYRKEFDKTLETPKDVVFDILTIDTLKAALAVARKTEDSDPDFINGTNNVRKVILDKTVECNAFDVGTFQFPKPTTWAATDKKELSVAQASRKHIEKQAKEKNGNIADLVADICSKRLKISDINLQITKLRNYIKEYDTNESILLATRQKHADWKFLSNSTVEVEYVSQYPITSKHVSTEGTINWEKDTSYHVKATVTGKNTQTTDFKISFYTQSSFYYAKEIKERRNQIEMKQAEINMLEDQLNKSTKQNSEGMAAVQKLESELKNIDEQIRELQSETLTIQQIERRLQAEEKRK